MGCCFEGDVSEVWVAMKRVQRNHKSEERPMTERLGPAGVLAMGSTG